MELKYDSKIDGEFKGWDGETVFKLMNGTQWQQAKYKYKYKYKYRPGAKIWRDGNRYYLEVDGLSEKLQVRKI